MSMEQKEHAQKKPTAYTDTKKDTKKKLCYIGRRMKEGGLIVACDGNMSYRRDEGTIVITPSGVPKGELKPSDLLVMDMKGRIVKGNGKASTETNLHLQVYKLRPDVKAIVHCHPITATAVSVAGLEFPRPRLSRTCYDGSLCRTRLTETGQRLRQSLTERKCRHHDLSRRLHGRQ